MLYIAPFKGLRYNLRRVGSLSKVVTPPYDIISPKEQAAYYRLHPYNFIRVVYGKEYRTDGAGNNRYTRAKKTFEEWLRKGILREDNEPSFYPHVEEYTLEGKRHRRWGVIALVRLDSKIYRHEHTRPKPITDRIHLLEALKAPLSPIFGLIPDSNGAYQKFITAACRSSKPVSSVRVNGVLHVIWQVSDPGWIKKLTGMLKTKELVIADGHHRLEAVLHYRNSRRKKDRSYTPESPYNYAMFYLAAASSEEPGLLPTHRMLRGVTGAQLKRFMQESARHFFVHRLKGAGDMASRLKSLRDRKALGVGLYTGNGTWVLLQPRAKVPYELDVEWLHQEIIPQWMGKSPEISYTQDIREGIQELKSRNARALFMMQPPRLEDVLGRARSTVRMPRKTTYFYPKPLAGLVEYTFGRS